MHNPNLDINTVLANKGENVHTVYQPVSVDNRNFFKVKWHKGRYPTFGQCGTCEQVSDGCLCDVVEKTVRVFAKRPSSVQAILSNMKIGSPPPDWLNNDYELSADTNGVKLYVLSKDKAKLPKLTKRAILGVSYQGEMKYFLNYKSIVRVHDGTALYKFRNPSSMMRIIEQRTRDAYYETEAVLDHYVQHANTAPFIAKLMIKKLVTSNPSPSYVRRVVLAFKSGLFQMNGVEFGDGRLGNLEAMFAAIILDDEARDPVIDADPSYGSLKEPLVKVLSFMRAMEFKMNDEVPTLRFNKNIMDTLGQEPFKSLNVFSFFSPDYAAPGAVKEASLVSPEAQIINAPTVVGILNGIMSMIDVGLSDCFGGFGMKTVNNCNGYKNYDTEKYSRGTLSYNPISDDTSTIVDELVMLLTAGRLTQSSRLVLEAAYDEVIQGGGSKDKALRTIQKLVVMAPEFHSTGVFQPTGNARPEPALPEDPTYPYKALVYVNLSGGLDTFNTLVPLSGCNGDGEDNCCNGKHMYAEYSNVRGSVALSEGSFTNANNPISASGQVCSLFGVHPKLPIVRQLYNNGELSFFANMGVLQQPVTDKSKYRELNKKTAL